MKKILLALTLLLSVAYFMGCEKDDICAATTATTPALVIEFYDAENPETLKNITNLAIKENGVSDGRGYNGVSKIKLPLNSGSNQVQYQFFQNYNSTDNTYENLDTLEINYTRKDEFISRACGFKTLFYLNETGGINLINDGNNWLKSTLLITPNILNENETHLKIYH